MAAARVDFYVLASAEERAWLKFACRLCEKAYLAGQRILVWHDDAPSREQFDTLLWTFGDRSFVPHEPFESAAQWQDTPVLLGGPGQCPDEPFDLLINLGRAVPPVAGLAARIAEIVDAEDARREAGRERFRQHRERGTTPQTHNITGEAAAGA